MKQISLARAGHDLGRRIFDKGTAVWSDAAYRGDHYWMSCGHRCAWIGAIGRPQAQPGQLNIASRPRLRQLEHALTEISA